MERITGKALAEAILQWLAAQGLPTSAMMVPPTCQGLGQDVSLLLSSKPVWQCTSTALHIG